MTLFNKLLISSENYKGSKSLVWDSLAMGITCSLDTGWVKENMAPSAFVFHKDDLCDLRKEHKILMVFLWIWKINKLISILIYYLLTIIIYWAFSRYSSFLHIYMNYFTKTSYPRLSRWHRGKETACQVLSFCQNPGDIKWYEFDP